MLKTKIVLKIKKTVLKINKNSTKSYGNLYYMSTRINMKRNQTNVQQ